MTRSLNNFIALALTLSFATAWGHEGHDQTPGSIKSLHGGTVLSGKQINLEYLFAANELKLYPLSHEGKDIPLSDVSFKVSAKSPKGKAEVLTMKQMGTEMTGSVDFKGSYRLEVNVTTEFAKKQDKFKFQIEK